MIMGKTKKELLEYGSKEWEKRSKEIEQKTQQRREKYGFIKCPECNTLHTNKTLMCRNCGYSRKRKKKFEKISKSKSVELLDKFENMLRQGAGSSYWELIFIKNELLRRMEERNDSKKSI